MLFRSALLGFSRAHSAREGVSALKSEMSMGTGELLEQRIHDAPPAAGKGPEPLYVFSMDSTYSRPSATLNFTSQPENRRP